MNEEAARSRRPRWRRSIAELDVDAAGGDRDGLEERHAVMEKAATSWRSAASATRSG